MDVLSQLLSLSNVILALAIVGLVWFQRKGMETFFSSVFKKDLKKSKIWTEFLVPIGPLGTGALLMLAPFVPVPEMFSGGISVKMIFGLALGMVSGLLYRLLKKNVLDKLGKTEEEETPYDK